jgi:hypothetical protein
MILIGLSIDEDYAFGITNFKVGIKDGQLFNVILISAFITNLYEMIILNSSSRSSVVCSFGCVVRLSR